MTQHFSFFKPEKWNWQKEFVSFHEIECTMYVSTYIVWVTCQIQMKFYCFSHAIKKVFDHEFQSHSNPTDIAHLEIMFFAQPNLAISPPILWSAENGSHEYLTDFIHFGIWFIWSAAWIFQLKKNMYKLLCSYF